MKHLLPLVLILLACEYIQAQNDGYRPFIEEGKVWVVLQEIYHPDYAGLTAYRSTFTIAGDTIIGEMECKIMRCQVEDRVEGKVINEYLMSLYEEGKRVYFYPMGVAEPLLLYDFGASVNDTINIYLGDDNYVNQHAPIACEIVVLKKDETGVMLGNISNKELFHQDDLWEWKWMEGVGSIAGPTVNMTYGPQSGFKRWLAECRVGDTILYRSEDQDLVTAPTIHNSHPSSLNHWYTLSGRQLSTPPTRKGIYIHEGRKVIIK
jgi:hypothetical protein